MDAPDFLRYNGVSYTFFVPYLVIALAFFLILLKGFFSLSS